MELKLSDVPGSTPSEPVAVTGGWTALVTWLSETFVRLGAAGETFSYHIGVWREALARDRAAPKRTALGKAELAFLPAALEVSERPAPPLARAVALTIAAFVVVAIAWACIGEMDIVATAAGRIVPSERVKQIQPLETSIVRAIKVAEGQAVNAGDILVELEVTGGQADMDRVKAEFDTARLDVARLEALLLPDPARAFAPPAGVPQYYVDASRALMTGQFKEHQAKLAALDAEMTKKRSELKTVETDIKRLAEVSVKINDETVRRQELATLGYGSQIDRARSEKELADNFGQQQVQKAKRVEASAGIEALRTQGVFTREEFRRDITAKLAEAKTKVAVSQQELNKATDRQRVQSLKAPVDGIVQQIEVHTIGGVVTPAQKLMVVVPKDSGVEIEAKLPNKDIGFVEVGQEAAVKIDAFPFTKYGTLPAVVEKVSLDAVKDDDSQNPVYVFPIQLSLKKSFLTLENGKRVPLSAGMTVIAEVKTGTRRPIEYVLAPLKKYGAESGRER